MIIVGLTGGIGSGKTTIANIFKTLDVPVYIADDEAKKLMNKSKVIKRQLTKLLGDKTYIDNKLNKPYIAKKIFNNEALLKQMNAIVHPKVARHFKKWLAKQNTIYVIKEAAILFENNSYKNCDYIITVTAPQGERIKRVIKRDNSNKEKVLSIIKNQWTDEEKIKKSTFVIKNITIENTKKQVVEIHTQLLNKIKKLC